MKILITGGLGHIGSYLLENIDKIKFIKKIYVIDNLSTNRYNSLFNLPKTNKKIYFYQKDLALKNALKNFNKVDIIINLASSTDAESSLKKPNEIYRNNLGIFQKVLKVKEENILKKNREKINFVSYRFGTISGVSKGMRFHTAINKFCLNAALGKPLPIWKSMMAKPRPYLSLSDVLKVFKFTIENSFFNNNTFNIISQNLTLKKIISYFKKYKKNIRIKYETSKLTNQYSYKVSNKKFSKQALVLKSKIQFDIKSTLKIFRSINNEM